MAGGEFNRPVRSRFLVVAALAALLAGCNGGTVDRHALTNDSATLDSIACEGALLAHDVARGRTTVVLSRASRRRSSGSSRRTSRTRSRRGKTCRRSSAKVRAKAKDAATLAAVLQRLHDHPSDRARRRAWSSGSSQQLGRLRVSKVLGLALGILAAIGGFVDIGDLVFNVVCGRDVRLPADVGDPDRRRRDHRLLGDVRARRGRLGQGRVRRGARAGRVQGRARGARRRPRSST